MHSSIMNALIKLLLNQGNNINCLKGCGGGGERRPEKVVTRCAGTGIKFFRGQFLPGHHQASGGNFCPA